MFNQEYEEIRRQLQSRIVKFSNDLSTLFRDDLSPEQWKAARNVQKLDKKLMAAIVGLQRENNALTKLGVRMTKALLKI